MPKLEQFEIKKYWQIFSGLKPKDQKVTHDQVLPILYNSKQDSSVLNKIWFLADIDDDDMLDFEEFVICMRLVFDMVNKNIDSVPNELPDWLIPGSKIKLVKERIATKAKENETMPPPKEVPKIEWYMSPEDTQNYKNLLNNCSRDQDGTLSLTSLQMMIKNKFFNVGSSDMDKVWKLVNPRGLPAIDNDPALYFIHILRQCNDLGALIPNEVPKNLANSFNKEPIKYDLANEQSKVTRTTESTTTAEPSKIETQKNSTSSTVSRPQVSKTTNESSLNGTITSPSTTANNNDYNDDVTIDTTNLTYEKARLIREQLQGLLNYKNEKYVNNNTSNDSNYNINSFNNDLQEVEQQVNELEQYLTQRQNDLNDLNNEINQFK